MGRGRTWTKEEIDYLRNMWGEVSIKGIAKKLDRSINAVKLKAYRVGLQSPVEYMDGVLIHHFAKETGISYSTIMYWIENKGFPAKRKLLIEENRYWYLNIDDFWEWAEDNKDLINFAELEKNILGAEPEWVEEMRKRDRKNIAKTNSNKKPWTKADDKRLEFMLEQFRYTYTDIARYLGRSEAAIKRRIYDLGIKTWPIRSKSRDWTKKEIDILLEMDNKGYGYDAIADELNRSEHSVRGKLKRLQRKKGEIDENEKTKIMEKAN